MNKRSHLKRLPPECYRSDAVVHWSMTTLDRKVGWLTPVFYYRFRELLTHTCFRYELVCPIFCLMPDHMHMLWMGLQPKADQKLAIRHLRRSVNESLRRVDIQLQDQGYDHVLSLDEKTEAGFRQVFEYIARNPERAGLVPVDGFREYRFTGCIVPGYPELRPFAEDYWEQFDRIISFIRRRGFSFPQTDEGSSEANSPTDSNFS